MICCIDCFQDVEIRAAIEMIGQKGNCPICNKTDTWVYDSIQDLDKTNIEEMLDSILEVYVPESCLPLSYPDEEKMPIEKRLLKDWKIFSDNVNNIKQIVEGIVFESLNLDSRIITEPVGIPQLFDDVYLNDNSIMGKYNWNIFKKCLRNENRFHNKYINLEMLELVLRETKITIPKDTKFYRARISDENGYKRKEMWQPPDDAASAGRANSKGQSCLYLCSNKKTTVKEIRARAFDYVTIATFKLNRDVRVLDLSAIVHSSPFYYSGMDKIAYLVNEKNLRQIQDDMAKPISRLDSELDYLPTQYISDFAKSLGYDGVKYFSTFDKTSYNVELFNSAACNCTYHRNFLIGDLEYKMTAI